MLFSVEAIYKDNLQFLKEIVQHSKFIEQPVSAKGKLLIVLKNSRRCAVVTNENDNKFEIAEIKNKIKFSSFPKKIV